MKFFKKPFVAFILSAAVVLASTLLSVNIRLGDECEDVIDGFYDGVYYDGAMHESIASQLHIIRESAEDIAHIAKKYGVNTEELLWASDDLRYGLIYSEEDISYLYYCYEELLDELRNITDELDSAGLSSEDTSLIEGYLANIQTAQELIKTAGYNESVREFSKNHIGALAEFLGKLAGVDFPEQFS